MEKVKIYYSTSDGKDGDTRTFASLQMAATWVADNDFEVGLISVVDERDATIEEETEFWYIVHKLEAKKELQEAEKLAESLLLRYNEATAEVYHLRHNPILV